MNIERFEDLMAWQSARELCREFYSLARSTPLRKEYPLRDQMLGSAISPMSNIAEGYHAGSDAEFTRFLRYAQRSNGELRFQLYVCLDAGYLDQARFAALQELAQMTHRLLGGLIRYLTGATNQVREEPGLPLILAVRAQRGMPGTSPNSLLLRQEYMRIRTTPIGVWISRQTSTTDLDALRTQPNTCLPFVKCGPSPASRISTSKTSMPSLMAA